jgi:hypothetical protein
MSTLRQIQIFFFHRFILLGFERAIEYRPINQSMTKIELTLLARWHRIWMNCIVELIEKGAFWWENSHNHDLYIYVDSAANPKIQSPPFDQRLI